MNRSLSIVMTCCMFVFAAACGGGGGGGGEATTCDDFSAAVSVQIQAAQDQVDASGLALPIHGALVTYVKGEVGDDVAGFFVQGQQTGPAMFVAVDPATLDPVPVVGDQVSFTVTEMGTTGSLREAIAISGYSQLCQEDSVSALSQDLSSAVDLVSNLDGYESELIDLAGTVVSDFGAAGTGFVSAQIESVAVTNDTNFKVRLPSTLQVAIGLENGCEFTIDDVPLWRFNGEAQPSAWNASDIQVSNCPAPPDPQVVSAMALTTNSVRVTFDSDIDGSSITSAATQFTFNGGLAASSAVADSTIVTVATTGQSAGASYTVTVANSVKDTLGTGIDAGANTADFTGYQGVQALIINEILYDGDSGDIDDVFVEIKGTDGISLNGYYLVGVNGNGGTDYNTIALSGTIPADGYFVVAGSSDVSNADTVNANTDYQNGPSDNVQLVYDYNGSEEQVLDAVGYGVFAGSDVFAGESTPTVDVDPGHSLSRCPDGTDTDDNSSDFLDTVAVSPGESNICTGQLCSTEEIGLFGDAVEAQSGGDPNALQTLWNSDQLSQDCEDATIAYLSCVETNTCSDLACIQSNCATEFYDVYGVNP